MIKTLYIGNFKAFGKTQKIPIKPITLIFGPNSSGKSSVMHSLLFAKHTHKTNVFDVHKTELGDVDLGGFPYYVNKHDPKKTVTIGFDLSIENSLEKFFPELDFNMLNIIFHFKKNQNYIEFEKCNIFGDNQQLAEFSQVHDFGHKQNVNVKCQLMTKTFILNIIKSIGKQSEYVGNDYDEILCDKEFFNNAIKVGKNIIFSCDTGLIPHLVKNNVDSKDTTRYIKFEEYLENCLCEFFNSFFNKIKKLLDLDLYKTKYLGPLRCYPDRHIFSSTAYNLKDFSTGENAWNILLSKEEIRNYVNDWMDRIFNNTYEFKIKKFKEIVEENIDKEQEKLKELYLFDKKWKVRLTHHDVGHGISQVLPIIVTALTYNYTKILIEQPELHLHPALQADLGDLFIETALGANKNTFLLETHSEHLILRIMRRIRECYQNPEKYKETGLPPITPDDVAVLYVERQGEESVVKEMRLDEEGYLIDEWPGGFFTEDLDEVM